MQKAVNLLRSDRTIFLAAIVALACCAAFLLLRIGVLPLASGGDDVWFDESGYWLLHEGVLRRHIHQNAIGDGVRDFLPPIAGFMTAASFRTFGLTQFAVGFAPLLATLIGLGGFAGALRNRFRLSPFLALGLTTAIFYSPDFLKVPGHNRFEAYVLMFVGLGLLIGSFVPRRPLTKVGLPILAGLAAGGAIAAHYPVAPLSWGIVALWACWRPEPVGTLVPFGIGTCLAGLLGLLWVGGDISLFLSQMITSSGRYDHALALVPRISLLYLGISLACLAIVYRSAFSRCFAALGIVATLSIPWWNSAGFYGTIAVTIALVSFVWPNDRIEEAPAPSLPSRALLLAMLVSVSLFSVVSTVLAIRSYPERNFAAFKDNLLKVMPRDNGGLVLIDRVPHLALRSCYSARELHHMVVRSAVTLPSQVLLDPGRVGTVQAIVASPDLQDEHATYLPLYRAFMARPLKAIDVSPFGIGRGVRHAGPYHVIVYLPASDSGPRLVSSCR